MPCFSGGCIVGGFLIGVASVRKYGQALLGAVETQVLRILKQGPKTAEGLRHVLKPALLRSLY